MNKKFTTKSLTKMALLTALLCVSAFITIPLGFTPANITLQTLIVTLMAFLLSPMEAFFSVLVYILLGLVGLPVFSGGIGGAGKLFGPTGGYIFAFLVAAPVMSLIKPYIKGLFSRISKGKAMKLVSYILVGICGMLIIYAIGTAYMMFSLKKTLIETLALAVLPFIPLDIVKCVLASVIAIPLEKALSK